MEPTPDFSTYSTPDLLDAIAHINAEKFPHIERAAREELARREAQSVQPKSTFAGLSSLPHFVSLLLILWGAKCVGFALYMQFTPLQSGYRNDFEPWFLFLIGVGPLVVGLWNLNSKPKK